MNVAIRGIGWGADAMKGPCELRLKSRGPQDEEFIRALHSCLVDGADEDAARVIENRFGVIFEHQGWSRP